MATLRLNQSARLGPVFTWTQELDIVARGRWVRPRSRRTPARLQPSNGVEECREVPAPVAVVVGRHSATWLLRPRCGCCRCPCRCSRCGPALLHLDRGPVGPSQALAQKRRKRKGTAPRARPCVARAGHTRRAARAGSLPQTSRRGAASLAAASQRPAWRTCPWRCGRTSSPRCDLLGDATVRHLAACVRPSGTPRQRTLLSRSTTLEP